MKRAAQMGAGLLIGAGCLAYVLSRTDLHQLAGLLASIDPWWLIPAILANAAAHVVKAEAWRQLLLASVPRVRLLNTWMAYVIGLFLNNVFPGKVGEVGRILILSRREAASRSMVLSTAYLDRVLDLLVLAGGLFAVCVAMPVPEQVVRLGRDAAAFGAVLAALSVAVFIPLILRGVAAGLADDLARLRRRLLGPVDGRVMAIYLNVVHGFRAVRTPRRFLAACVGEIVFWALIAVDLDLVARAVGVPLSPSATFIGTATMALGRAVPVPGGIGTVQAMGVMGLVIFGLSREQALGVTLIHHGIGLILETVLGLALTSMIGWSMVTRREANVEQA